MLKISKILCVGDNSIDTDAQCKKYANEYQLEYRGLLLDNNIIDGCYHTSIMDTSITFIGDIYENFDKVIFLKQNNTITDILANTYSISADPRKNISDSDILFVGCSHTAGIGHSDQTTVYTHQFANVLNLTPMVCGNPGQGNYVIEDQLANYNLSGKKIIIQFTDIFRIRYFSTLENKVIHKMGHEFSRAEVEMFHDVRRLQYEYFKIVDRVVSKLRDCGAKFLFFQLTQSTGKLQEETDFYQSQYQEFCYVADINVDIAEDKLHYGPMSHQLIAKELTRKWNKLYAEAT
jgi:hypothetical protein